MRYAAVAAALVAACLLLLGVSPGPGLFFQRGVNFTAEWPDIYASERSVEILSTLPAYGVNAIAVVPYGIARSDAPLIRFGGNRMWEKDESVVRVARLAHERGIKVLLKPQLWVRRGYPGDLDFSSQADLEAWFTQYDAFIRHYAALASRIRADVFCVGVEFSRMTRHEKHWRAAIARVRAVYAGPLVYGANWGEEFENLQFWDALDYIGLNQYYPLPDNLSTDTVVAKIESVHRRFHRPVIFTEAGFASLEGSNRQPWDETPRKLSLEEQARCYEAVLKAFYRKPWFHGVYWWKVGSNGFGGPEDGSHTPWGKPAMDVVARWYLRGGR
jgi:hypothetical protein